MPGERRKTRRIFVGDVPVGGGAPISIQSMANTDTRNVEATVSQIRRLAGAGCEIVRVAVPDMKAASSVRDIVAGSPIPVVADIHFDYRLALESVKAGAHAIRLNPGNIGSAREIKAVAGAVLDAGIPVRVGANSGSLRRGAYEALKRKCGSAGEALAEALVLSALEQCSALEKYGVCDIKVSLKASSVPVTIDACRRFSRRHEYPMHLGITEAGTMMRGIIKSSAGIAPLLLEGIGDTIRISLTADPIEEVRAALMLLEALGLREPAPDIVSCPTCGRTGIDIISLAERVEREVERLKQSAGGLAMRKIAVMGCAVNGPGEARDADLGIAGAAHGKMVVFRKGRVLGAFGAKKAFDVFIAELAKFAGRRRA